MKKLLFWSVAILCLWYLLSQQWWSPDRMGERRFTVLSKPSQEILVGVSWPFSVNQDGMADGLRLALEEINSRKLAGNYTIRLVMRDDEFDSEKSKQIALDFARDPEMSAVIGYYDDGPALTASAIFENSRLLHLVVGANNTPMTMHGFQYLVRTTLSGDKIAQALARISSDRGYHKIALIWEEDAFGEDLAYQFYAALDALNSKVVYQSFFRRGREDFRLSVNELKGVDADVIFSSGLEPWAGDFLFNARRVGVKTPIIGALSDTSLMRQRAGSGLEGAMYYEIYDEGRESPENQAFIRKFRAKYGKTPDAWAAQGYDALLMLAKAVNDTGSRNPLDLSYAIKYMDPFEGANGRYKFTSSGELEDKPIFLKMYQQGVPVLIQKSVPAKSSEK